MLIPPLYFNSTSAKCISNPIKIIICALDSYLAMSNAMVKACVNVSASATWRMFLLLFILPWLLLRTVTFIAYLLRLRFFGTITRYAANLLPRKMGIVAVLNPWRQIIPFPSLCYVACVKQSRHMTRGQHTAHKQMFSEVIKPQKWCLKQWKQMLK